jgi:polyvinyl alcohol dehydrogenase (cytochrome)
MSVPCASVPLPLLDWDQSIASHLHYLSNAVVELHIAGTSPWREVHQQHRRARTAHERSNGAKLVVVIVAVWLSLLSSPAHTRVANDSIQLRAEFEGLERQTESAGGMIFHHFCSQCHGKLANAPTIATLRTMSSEKIYESLTTGAMKNLTAAYSSEQKRLVAEYLAGRRLGAAVSGDAKDMPNPCRNAATIGNVDSDAWNGWGRDLSNSRFQSASSASLAPEAVSRLKLRWAFALSGATSIYGQPTIVDGKIFVSADSGYVYALDAATGCVFWSFQATAGVRSAVTIGPIPAAQRSYAAYFGDVRGNVYAVDAVSGQLLWKVSAEAHTLARISGAVKLYKDRLYVPVASLEEPEAFDANYRCCTFRGSMVALDTATGKTIWKTYTIAQEPERRTTSAGAIYWGPSGAGVWNSPAIDPKRNSLYFGTGNAFSGPPTAESDAVFALDLDTGKILWSKQALANDIWVPGCGPGHFSDLRVGGYCPNSLGPDQDIGAGVILTELAAGRRLAIVAQKSIGVWTYDPDDNGTQVWHQSKLRPSAKPGRGGSIVFGGAADKHNVYFALASSSPFSGTGGLVALELTTGKLKWFRAVPAQNSQKNHPGISAAVSVIPGVLFSGGLDGMLRAFSTADGSPLWAFDTTQKLETVNGTPGKGGSIGSAGPVIAGGSVFVTSGYVGFQNGVPGNLLLAFSP